MMHHRLAILVSHVLVLMLGGATLAWAQAPRLVSAASRMAHGGASHDVALPLTGASGIEPRNVAGGLTLVLSFDRPIRGGTAAVSAGVATIDGKGAVSGNTMTIRLSKVANRQALEVTVTDVTGGGRAGAPPVAVRLRTLEGDVDADGTVSRQDVTAVTSRAGGATDGFNFRADTDLNGSVSAGDVNRTRAQVGQTVPGGAAADSPPTIGQVASQTAFSGRASTSVGFNVSDSEMAADALVVRATSSDQTLLPDSAISLGGTGSIRNVFVTPVAGRIGKATVTLSVSDGLTTRNGTYELTVLAPPTLYIARLTPQPGAQSLGSGYSTLLLAGDELSATIRFTYTNLSSPEQAKHVHEHNSNSILLDLDPPFPANVTLNPDGSYTWVFVPTGQFSVAQVVDAIKQGRTYINIHSTNYPAGEIRGNYLPAGGSQTFTPPPDPPALPAGPPTAQDAARFLTQATFGPTEESIAQLQAQGFDAWLNEQFEMPPTLTTPLLNERTANGEFPQGANQSHFIETWWNRSLRAPDQLRQRVAFALSEILVVSFNDGALAERPFPVANYYDLLLRDAFKNYRTILEDVTLNPAMGVYLDMQGNGKATATTNPNENYAREVLQLFSIGVYKLWPDGTLRLDEQGLPIPTYDQSVIEGFARVFTGWNWHQTGSTSFNPPANYIDPMTLVPAFHEPGTKQLLDGVVLPAGQGGARDLADALNQLYRHPNAGPFISRQLIQRLVTSNPSPAYVYRVARKFDNNGQGARGDMRAVVRAILTDYEARSATVLAHQGYGKLREPLLRATAMIRAFHPTSASGYFKIGITDVELGQSPMRAPTVFNFFEPGYTYPGVLAQAGMVAPEFAISSETEVVETANFLELGSRTAFPRGNDIRLDLATERALASNPAALVDRMSGLLMAGSMPAPMRTRIINHLNTITSATHGANNFLLVRAQAAVHLTVTSPEFAIQR
jgi:uncharacterized protein (DUF1800 family)